MMNGKSENNPLRLKSTKQCICGNTQLILLRTLNLKICSKKDCCTYIYWPLAANQKQIA